METGRVSYVKVQDVQETFNSTPCAKNKEIINRNMIQKPVYANDMTPMLGLFNEDYEAANKNWYNNLQWLFKMNGKLDKLN